MKIQQYTKKKGGAVYWTYTAEDEEDRAYLESFETLKPSKWGNAPTWYGGDTRTHELITAKAQTKEGEDMSKEEAREMSVQDLRKAAADKAKAEGKPTTDLRTKWTKEQLADYLANGTWPEVNTGNGPDAAQLGAMMAQMIAQFMPPQGIDEERVREIVGEVAGLIPQKVQIVMPDMKEVDAGIQHSAFPMLMKLAALRMDAMLTGPAGGGKTTVCHNVANTLELKFYPFSVGPQTTESKLLGYMDAHGKYVSTPLYTAYKEGGVFLLDEVDAGNSGILTALNALLANGGYTFPNGEYVKRHADFVCFAAANTFGRGADRLYVGRNQLDAATLDRFAAVVFDYDEKLERAIARNDDWTALVQSYRKAAFDLKERVVISPRASIKGAQLIAAGFTWDQAEEMVVWKGVSSDIKTKIISSAAVNRERIMRDAA